MLRRSSLQEWSSRTNMELLDELGMRKNAEERLFLIAVVTTAGDAQVVNETKQLSSFA